MNPITCLMNETQIEKLYQAWKEFEVKTPPYALYQLKPENCTITAYTSRKVVFQGKDAEIYASAFLDEQVQKNSKPACTVSSDPALTDHAGSDEVGTGDYFGPVCVCACAVRESDLRWLKELKVNDSKQITDEHIIKTAPLLMEKLDYSLLILPPAKYNRVHQQCNMNQIKAILHNQAYVHLRNKMGKLPSVCVVDQFTPEKSYYRYCSGQKEIQHGLHFETKAESRYPAVACASMIARYAFLKSWEAMEEQWNMTFIKGASDAVDRCAVQFIHTHGQDKLDQVAKIHFKNTEKALEKI